MDEDWQLKQQQQGPDESNYELQKPYLSHLKYEASGHLCSGLKMLIFKKCRALNFLTTASLPK